MPGAIRLGAQCLGGQSPGPSAWGHWSKYLVSGARGPGGRGVRNGGNCTFYKGWLHTSHACTSLGFIGPRPGWGERAPSQATVMRSVVSLSQGNLTGTLSFTLGGPSHDETESCFNILKLNLCYGNVGASRPSIRDDPCMLLRCVKPPSTLKSGATLYFVCDPPMIHRTSCYLPLINSSDVL